MEIERMRRIVWVVEREKEKKGVWAEQVMAVTVQ